MQAEKALQTEEFWQHFRDATNRQIACSSQWQQLTTGGCVFVSKTAAIYTAL
jgi:hypothetical protein